MFTLQQWSGQASGWLPFVIMKSDVFDCMISVAEFNWVLRTTSVHVYWDRRYECHIVRLRNIRYRQSYRYCPLSVGRNRAVWEEAVAHGCVIVLPWTLQSWLLNLLYTVGAFLMGLFFFILGGLFKTHPPNTNSPHVSNSSIAMAVMIYLYGGYPLSSFHGTY